jgi:simple sugar transport system substrate-binding protein
MKIMGLLAGSTLIALLAAGCATDDKSGPGATYYFTTHGIATNSFWSVVRMGMEEAASAYNVNAVYMGPKETETAEEVKKLFNEAVALNPDGIAVTITDVATLRDSINSAVSAGIPVIAINNAEVVSSNAQRTISYLFYIGQDDTKAGYGVAQKVQAYADSKKVTIARAVCFKQYQGLWADRRCTGMTTALSKITVDTVQLDMDKSPAGVQGLITDYFKSHPETNYIQATAALSLNAILKYTPSLDKKLIASVDLSDDTISAIENGEVLMTVDQQPYLQGFLPIVHFELYRKYSVLPGDDILTGPNYVDASNVSVVKDLISRGYR